jgi:hypothetical protein
MLEKHLMAPFRPAPERFAEKYRVDADTGCWVWTASFTRGGYGQFGFGGITRRAHRVSWVLHRGPIPDGLWVLHKCDNPPCVNPDHLFLGTCSDNSRDCVAKGRHKPFRTTGHKGEGNPNARLNEGVVRDIRSRVASGEKVSSVVSSLGTPEGTVRHVVRRTSWKHVA